MRGAATNPTWAIDPEGDGYHWGVQARHELLAGGRFPVTSMYGGWEPSFRKARRQVRQTLKRWRVPRSERP